MRLVLLAVEVVFHPGIAAFFEDDILAPGIDEEVAWVVVSQAPMRSPVSSSYTPACSWRTVCGADRAVALVDHAFAFGRQCLVQGDRIPDQAAVAVCVVCSRHVEDGSDDTTDLPGE